MHIIRRYPALVALLLGAAAACGFAPLEAWPLTLACFAAWMAIVHDAPTARQALWRGWAFGVGHFTINDNWFQHAFDFQDKMPPMLGYAAPVALALFLGVYPMIAAGLAWRMRGRAIDLAYVAAFAAAWIAGEWLRSVMFTGYAWDPLGVIWIAVPDIARVAAAIGTYALSGLTVLASGALALLVVRRDWKPAAVIVVVAAGRVALGGFAPPLPADPNAPLVRVVQPDIGNDVRAEDGGEQALATLIRGTRHPEGAPRLVLWPEGLLRDFLEDGYPAWIYRDRTPEWMRGRIAAALGRGDVLMTSADTLTFDRAGDVASAANSVLAIDSAGRIVGRYDKTHLVPYGEYLPMPWLLKPLGLARLVPGDMDFSPGPGVRTLAVPGFGAIGVQVCYEIIFSGQVVDPARRPRLIFNPSNDAWFGRWGSPQFLAQARMRAIEEGLPVVRATPTGISAIIGADGAVLASVPHDVAGAIEVPMPPAAPPTLFSRFGNVMAGVVALILAAMAVALRRRGR